MTGEGALVAVGRLEVGVYSASPRQAYIFFLCDRWIRVKRFWPTTIRVATTAAVAAASLGAADGNDSTCPDFP